MNCQFDALCCHDLHKSWRNRNESTELYSGLNMNLAPGQTLWLTGSNGSGKTTLLYLFAGLYTADKGRVHVFGKSPHDEPKIRSRIGFSPSNEDSFFLNITARDNLIFSGNLFGIKQTELKSKIDLLARRFHLNSVLDKKMSALSAGYKKIFSLVRIFLHDPDFIILDEPFDSLDSTFRDTFLDFFLEYQKSKPITTVIANLDAPPFEAQKITLNRTHSQ